MKKEFYLLASMILVCGNAIAQPFDPTSAFNQSLRNFTETSNRQVELAIKMQQIEMAKQRQEEELRLMRQKESSQQQIYENETRREGDQVDSLEFFYNREFFLKGNIGQLILGNMVLTHATVSSTLDQVMTGGDKEYNKGRELIASTNHFISFCHNAKQQINMMISSGIFNDLEKGTLNEYVGVYQSIENQARFAHDYFLNKDKSLVDGYINNKKNAQTSLAKFFNATQ